MTPFHAYSFVAAVIGFIMISVGVSQIINERSAARYEEAHVLSKNEYEYFTKCLESQQPLTQKKIDICQTTARDLELKGLLK